MANKIDNPADAISGILDSYMKVQNTQNEFKVKLLQERIKQQAGMQEKMAMEQFKNELATGRKKEEWDYQRENPKPPTQTFEQMQKQQGLQNVLDRPIRDIDESQLTIKEKVKKHWWSKANDTIIKDTGKPISPDVIKISEKLKTAGDVMEFFNNVGNLKNKYGDNSVQALYDYINDNVINELSTKDLKVLESNNFIEPMKDE